MQRPSPRFRSELEEYFVYEVSEEMFYPNLLRFVWRRHAPAHADGLQHGYGNQQKHLLPSFAIKAGIHSSRNS